MVTQEELLDIFPKESAIPEAYQLSEFLDQTEYLVNGELRYWDGPMNDVLSPVCIKGEDGSLTQKVIGRTPLLTSKESLEALDAATEAYHQRRRCFGQLCL